MTAERHTDEHEFLAPFAGDEGVGEGVVHDASYSIVAMCTTGTVMRMVSLMTTSAAPPGWRTTTCFPHSPHRWAVAAAAHAPVPQASVRPTPRSYTRIVNSPSAGPAA